MRITSFVVAVLATLSFANAQQPIPVALTIYDQSFAVARTSIDLDLHPGINEITTSGVTSMLEPDSVVLRDPTNKHTVQIVEQNYDAGVVNQQWLLEKYEGKTIDFQIAGPQGVQTIQGKIVRAGGRQGQPSYGPQGQYIGAQATQPLVEVDGHMQFQLPGLPLFPSATDGLLLKPILRWQIHSDSAARVAAELAYITGGLDWSATYNVVAPDTSDVTGNEKGDLLGWVTIHNQSGTEFPQARIKLMAGDVAKIQQQGYGTGNGMARAAVMVSAMTPPQVTQKAFDDFHLYDLNRTVALRDGETKQVQFIEAANVSMRRTYIYDGLAAQVQLSVFGGNVNQNRAYGLDGENHKVLIVEEIRNSDSNHLGMPIPAGRLRLYRRDADGQIEFVGESTINHTPAEETLRIPTGSAFDVRGTRRQTGFQVDYNKRVLEESFEIKVTNQKQQPVDVTVVEHMYRGASWEIIAKSVDFSKNDSQTLEFPVHVSAKGEETLSYSVRYTW